MTDETLLLIVEDERDLAETLSSQFTADGIHCRAFDSGEAALESARLELFGCALIDIELPGLSGLDLQARLIQEGFHFPLLLMSGHASTNDVVRAYENGAFRYFQKPVDALDLLASVRQALDWYQRCRRWQAARTDRLAAFTTREKEIVELLRRDMSVKQIARWLNISPSTVEKHRANIFAKVNVTSAVGLLTYLSGESHPPPSAHRHRPHWRRPSEVSLTGPRLRQVPVGVSESES